MLSMGKGDEDPCIRSSVMEVSKYAAERARSGTLLLHVQTILESRMSIDLR